MSQHQPYLHIIPSQHHAGASESSGRVAQQDEDAERRAAAESYRQYRILASAPIIWPPHLAQQQQQQLAFLWAQIDPRDQEQYIQEFYRLNPPYVPPQPPPNAIRGVEPIRLVNPRGQLIHVIENVPDDKVVEAMIRPQPEEQPGEGVEETDSPIPMMNREGRLVYLIR